MHMTETIISVVLRELNENIEWQIGSNTTLIIHSHPQSSLCPVKSTVAYLSCRTYKRQNNHSFIHLNSKPPGSYQFNVALQKAIKNGAIPGHLCTNKFSYWLGHRPSASGTPHADIQRFSRWKSTAFLNYIRIRLTLSTVWGGGGVLNILFPSLHEGAISISYITI